MNYYFKSVIPVIESNYNKFTTVEKSIADFFINNQKKADFSAKTVASKLFVSEASLSRFAQKCGYRGYREFIYQYEKNFVEKKETMAGRSSFSRRHSASFKSPRLKYASFQEASLNQPRSHASISL